MNHHHGILPTLQSLLNVLVVSLFLMTFTVQPIRIPSASMQPTLLVGDFLLLNRQSVANDPRFLPQTVFHHNDIIVFHDPVGDPSVHLVKRIVGLPGDRLHLRNNILYRNGEPQKEPWAVYTASPHNSFRDDFPNLQTMDPNVDPTWWIHLRALTHNAEITVPPNQFFVLGDNRNDSEDSRYWGFVPRQAIVGKPLFIYFSLFQTDEDDDEAPPPAHHPIARWNRTLKIPY